MVHCYSCLRNLLQALTWLVRQLGGQMGMDSGRGKDKTRCGGSIRRERSPRMSTAVFSVQVGLRREAPKERALGWPACGQVVPPGAGIHSRGSGPRLHGRWGVSGVLGLEDVAPDREEGGGHRPESTDASMMGG